MKRVALQLLALLARLVLRRNPGRIERVLVIKPDHLGDLLLATPALRQLRAGLPTARIVGLVGPWSRRVWQGNPHLDRLAELPFPGFERGAMAAHPFRPYLLLARYALLLRREAYDAALILRDDHWWGAALAAFAGIPRRVGHAHPLVAPFLSDALPYAPREHVARQSLDAVARLLGAPPSTPAIIPTTFVPSPAETAWAAAWVAANCGPGERLVVIHPGTGGPTKHWPAARWAAVGNALSLRPGVRLLLTGGPTEAPLVAEIAAQLLRSPLTLAGQTSVGQLAALLRHAAIVLGVDSGPLHLAVSQGVPSVHLFGPSDSARFGPWGHPERHVVLEAGLFCSPCGVFAACPRGTAGPECMAALPAATVIAVASRLLDAPVEGDPWL
ncbi:MAG: glycosyltransferase family 9 protein [Chloroflexi bacterium OHK40]